MRMNSGGAAAAILLMLGNGAFAASPTPAAVHVSGQYVEARTCNVYTGACHANGESVTTGREAIMAWQINQGTFEGVKLDGIKAIAVVAADANLAQSPSGLRAVLYIDSHATTVQRDAVARMFETQYAKQLGTVAVVKSAPITFERKGLEYTIRIPDTAYLKTTRYACDHCVMPHAVWYEPLISLKSSIVALSSINEFKGAHDLSTRWRRANENSSFVGEFAF